MHHDFGMERCLVGIRYSGELPDLALDGLLVKSLKVALRYHLQGAAHMNPDEPVDARTNFVAHGAIRGDGGNNGDHAVTRKELAHEADPSNVGVAIFLA